MKISNFGLSENLVVEVCLGILNEHVQHLFAICQQISLNSAFRENGRLTARNPFIIGIDKIFMSWKFSVIKVRIYMYELKKSSGKCVKFFAILNGLWMITERKMKCTVRI